MSYTRENPDEVAERHHKDMLRDLEFALMECSPRGHSVLAKSDHFEEYVEAIFRGASWGELERKAKSYGENISADDFEQYYSEPSNGLKMRHYIRFYFMNKKNPEPSIVDSDMPVIPEDAKPKVSYVSEMQKEYHTGKRRSLTYPKITPEKKRADRIFPGNGNAARLLKKVLGYGKLEESNPTDKNDIKPTRT